MRYRQGVRQPLEPSGERLPRADIATETLSAGLTALGWEVDDVTAYRTVRAAVPGAGTLVPYCMPGPLSVEIRYKRMEDAARAALTDRNGPPFAQPDPFTRSGVVDGVSALF